MWTCACAYAQCKTAFRNSKRFKNLFCIVILREPLLAIIRSIASLMHTAAIICFCSDHCIRIEIMLRVDHT